MGRRRAQRRQARQQDNFNRRPPAGAFPLNFAQGCDKRNEEPGPAKEEDAKEEEAAQGQKKEGQVEEEAGQAEEKAGQAEEEADGTEDSQSEDQAKIAELREQMQDLQSQLEDCRKISSAAEANYAHLFQLHRTLQDSLGKRLSKAWTTHWRWEDAEGTLCIFNMKANHEVEEAFQQWQAHGASSTHSTKRVTSGAFAYDIDFQSMSQTNVHTHTKRKVSRVDLGLPSHGGIVDRIDQVLELRAQEVDAANAERDSKAHELELLRAGHEAQVDYYEAQLVAADAQAMEQAAEFKREKAALVQQRDELEQASKKEKELADAAKQAQAQAERKVSELEKKLQVREEQHLDKVNKLDESLKQAQSSASEAKREAERQKQQRIEAEQNERETRVTVDTLTKERRSLEEFWRIPPAPRRAQTIKERSLRAACAPLLTALSHKEPTFRGLQSRCHAFQRMRVIGVESLHNPYMWRQYVTAKTDLREAHRQLGIKPPPLLPAFTGLKPFLPDSFAPDDDLNEVVLIHGCSQEASETIIKEGFDVRRAGTRGGAMYGKGVYFAEEPCKASQYTDGNNPRHLLIVRVTLGDCAYLSQSYDSPLPPERDPARPEKGRVDAIVVNPAASRQNQVHREFVIFDGRQAYPELRITYEIT